MNRQQYHNPFYMEPMVQWWVRGVFTNVIALGLITLDVVFINYWGAANIYQDTGPIVYFVFSIVITAALGGWSFAFNFIRACRQGCHPREEPVTRSIYFSGFQGFGVAVLVGGIGQCILWAIASAYYVNSYPELLGLTSAMSVLCLLLSVLSMVSIVMDRSERTLRPYTLRNHV